MEESTKDKLSPGLTGSNCNHGTDYQCNGECKKQSTDEIIDELWEAIKEMATAIEAITRVLDDRIKALEDKT